MPVESKSKHTPGPWWLGESQADVGKWFVLAHGYAPEERVATVDETGNDFGVYVVEANANLIAAAPDLLARLRSARTLIWALLSVGGVPERAQEPMRYELAACDAAIAKAEGRVAT